jgi:hypothetical protein
MDDVLRPAIDVERQPAELPADGLSQRTGSSLLERGIDLR